MADIEVRNIRIPQYKGNLPLVKELSQLIIKTYSDIFVAVIVHGSVATQEIIPYSDFDGLIIVKDAFINSEQLKSFKTESLRLILKFDPLQHHGWFQLSESQLNDYPETYLPSVVLEHARVFYPTSVSLDLQIKSTASHDFAVSLLNMITLFENREKQGWKPSNMYQLKSMLSQIMLIPSMLYAVKNNEGIFKKQSFEAVRPLFKTSEWMPIAISSKIRRDWSYSLNKFEKYMLTQPQYKLRKLSTRIFAPKIDPEISKELDEDFYQNLSGLINKVKQEIE